MTVLNEMQQKVTENDLHDDETFNLAENSLIKRLIKPISGDINDFFFIQVGANDGFTNDPINELIQQNSWSGILLEPQKRVYNEELKKTYEDSENLDLVNAAIDKTCGKKELYKVGFSDSKWATGLASFKKDMIEKQYLRGYVEKRAKEKGEGLPVGKDDYISTETVKTITFEKLMDEWDITDVNGLIVDAEGYDYKILQMFDFVNHEPEVVMFEHQHMTTNEQSDLTDKFRNLDYKLFQGKYNTLAILG